MDDKIWVELYKMAGNPPLNPVFVGFNLNLDRIIYVSRKLLESPEFMSAEFMELRLHLIHSMERCTAGEWFVPDLVQYARYTDFFKKTGSLTMGGQAGIAVLHLARLGIPNVICIAPFMGQETRDLLEKGGVKVPGDVSCNGTCQDVIHLVFEYKPGLVPLADGALARDNRFIASPEKTGENILLTEGTLAAILPCISSCTRAFLSGYQYLRKEGEFIRAAHQVLEFKKNNPDLRVHIECVSVTDEHVIAGIVHHILPAADSAGMNEHELSLMLEYACETSRNNRNAGHGTPASMAQGILVLAKKTGLARVHLHTFGYYLLVIRKDRTVPEDSRTALLYASEVVAAAAGGTGSCISAIGKEAVRQIQEVFGPERSPGIFQIENYWLIVIPTHIAENISKTSGLGDILSSTAFVADIF
jgi:ADP-dependent phosphofructokinase/glucokinase